MIIICIITGTQLEEDGGSPALKTLVRISALFENSMFLLNYKKEYLFRELNKKKNRHTMLKYIKRLELLFPFYVIIYDGELSEDVIIILIVNNESFRCNIRFLKYFFQFLYLDSVFIAYLFYSQRKERNDCKLDLKLTRFNDNV